MDRRAPRVLLVVGLLIATVALGTSHLGLAAPPFNDVDPEDPAYTAINELTSRGIIRGCDPVAGLFCPDDNTLRAQMAALIARAMGWDTENHGNPFVDRCDPAQGCIDDDLWRNVGTLQFYSVAKGFDTTHYGPHNFVLQQQVILFISRALVTKGIWQLQPDNTAIYPNLPRDTQAEIRDARDIVTFVHYVGAAPDTTATATWTDYAVPATRAWFARALWQVLAIFPLGPSPSPSAEPNPSPSASPQGNCSPAYPTHCIPPPPPDLDCGDIPWTNFTVLAPDPHRFDADHDGVGCED